MRKFNQAVDRALDRMLRRSTASAQQCYPYYGACRGCNCCAPVRTRRMTYLRCGSTLIPMGYQCC